MRLETVPPIDRDQKIVKKITERFKKLAGSDLKLDKNEYIKPFMQECAKHNYSIPYQHASDETLGSVLAGMEKRFDQFDALPKDGKLNVDEYINMEYDREYYNYKKQHPTKYKFNKEKCEKCEKSTEEINIKEENKKTSKFQWCIGK